MNKFLSTLLFVFLLNPIVFLCFKTESFSRVSQVSEKSQLAQILVQVQSKKFNAKSLRMIIQKIKDMLKDLKDTQDKHKKINDKMLKRCINEEKFRTKEIKDADTAFKNAEASLVKINNYIKKAKLAKKNSKQFKKKYELELKRATTQRKAEAKKFEEFSVNWNEGLKFMKDFKNLVKEKFGTPEAFAELSEKFLVKASSLNVLSAAPAVLLSLKALQDSHFDSMEHYEYQKDSPAIADLSDAIDKLISRIEGDLKKVTEREEEAIECFKKYSEKLEKLIKKFTDLVKKLKAQLKNLKKDKEREEEVSSEAQDKFERNTEMKDSGAKICYNFAKEFIEATWNRIEEIKCIKDILEIIKRRKKQLPEGFEAYLISTENGFEEYVNSTEFHKYIEYQRNLIDNNIEGEELTKKENKVVLPE